MSISDQLNTGIKGLYVYSRSCSILKSRNTVRLFKFWKVLPKSCLFSQQSLTWQGAIVGDEAGHVDVAVVYAQVLHAAHKLPVLNGEILRQCGDTTQQQRTCQV